MIKTVFFTWYFSEDEPIDKKINAWFAENHGIKLIDIKFQSNVSEGIDVLIIYKDYKDNENRI